MPTTHGNLALVPDDDSFNPLEITPEVARIMTALMHGMVDGEFSISVRNRNFFRLTRSDITNCPNGMKANRQSHSQHTMSGKSHRSRIDNG